MNEGWRTKDRELIILFVILGGSLCLLLANLGNQYLWQDEAETALVSKTILTGGLPRGYDGRNFFSQKEGADYGPNYIWRWHTWLPFYVLAGFYKVFGVSTFISRLPFVLFGFGTVLLIYYFARSLWPDTRIPVIAAALLAISVPFLLLCRQCRYYSMVMFFSLLSLLAYTALLQRKKFAAMSLFVTSTLLFHSQHIYIVSLFATILLHSIIFHRDRLKVVAAIIIVALLVNAPWFVWLAGVNYSKLHVSMLWRVAFLKEVVRYVFPLWLLAIALIAVCMNRIRKGRFFAQNARKMSLPVLFIILNTVVIIVITPFPFYRYMAPAIPLIVLLIAVIIDAAFETHWLLAVTTVVILIATGQLKDYVYEITHDYNGPEEGIVRYLNERGSPNDTVAISYGDLPLKFYTKMRVIGGHTGEDLEQAKKARWVVFRKYALDKETLKVKLYLLKNIEWEKYRQIVIDYPDILFENRESPGEHLFRTATNKDKVVIYERMN